VKKHHPGPVIRRARRAIEMWQSDLAACIGRSPAYVCNFELGRIEATPTEIVAMRAAIKAHRQAQQ
jgi:predicted transcriptional regulator